MNILILGPQGSGKGTQAQLLVDRFKLHYVDMGRILRSVVDEAHNKYGQIVKEHQEKGMLVPDEYVHLIAWDYISKHALKPDGTRENGFLFDGYPRSVAQYDGLKDMLARFGEKIDRVLLIQISEEESIKRLSARRICEKCGKIYNLITNPPPATEKCECGGLLIHREDDKPEAIKNRLKNYHQSTMPVIEKARAEGLLEEVDGERPIEEIHAEIVVRLEKDEHNQH